MLVLSTMLHGIGVGNMLPAWVRLVCVDINPAVVTKLADRGSSQTIGIVTDVGLFLRQLAQRLESLTTRLHHQGHEDLLVVDSLAVGPVKRDQTGEDKELAGRMFQRALFL